MASPTQTKQWILTNPPTDYPTLEGPAPTFTLQTSDLPALKPDEVLLKNLYLSNDPAQRAWIAKEQDPARLYTAPVVAGDIMRAGAIAEVIESQSDALKPGQLCRATLGWTQYAVKPAKEADPLPEVAGLSPTHFLGALGMTGLTAYYGIKEVVRAGPGETVVVSGAAGATGSMVVQIAKKMLGCRRVVAMAGTEEKCRWVESLGADVCLNYKSADFTKRLMTETEGFVEVYFDNVGGEILDLMLTRLKVGGRVAACGAIGDYNKAQAKKSGLVNWFEVIMNRLELRGFVVTDFLNKGGAPAAMKALTEAYRAGKIKIGDENETVVETQFEDVPKTWMKLFEGANTGKLVTKLA